MKRIYICKKTEVDENTFNEVGAKENVAVIFSWKSKLLNDDLYEDFMLTLKRDVIYHVLFAIKTSKYFRRGFEHWLKFHSRKFEFCLVMLVMHIPH